MNAVATPAPTSPAESPRTDVPLINHWIDGAPYEGRPERTGPVYDPATGELSAQVAFAGKAEVDRAVSTARAAFATWKEASLAQRARIMFAFRELVRSRGDDIAACLTREHGKVPEDAKGEVARGLEVVDFACGIPHLIKGEYSENVSGEVDSYSIRQPVGVVAGITPFNFPAMVPLWMAPIAIACGNCFVLKPSEKDPSAANLLAELFAQAGLPAGVFTVLHGDKDAVNGLLEHPDVAAVTCVGSTPVARHVYETAARHGKRVQALGGAKNHMVVLPDADMELAADSAVNAGYGSTGQRCMAISAIVTVGDAGDKLLPKVRERIAELKLGPGTDPAAQFGPLSTGAQRDKVVGYIEQGVEEGADLVVDGRDPQIDAPAAGSGGSGDGSDANVSHENGFFVGPTLFDKVTRDMTIYRDEIFGPVLCVLRADTYDEALELVNSNQYGNGTAIFTNDGGIARKFQHEVEVGMVGINVPIPVPMAFYSFGGWKQSLFGDTHMHGMEGVRFFTRAKAITTRWPDPRQRGVNLGFPQN